jgi:hypothetical protein
MYPLLFMLEYAGVAIYIAFYKYLTFLWEKYIFIGFAVL